MAGWLPFTAVAASITVLLLVFARQSQQLFEESADDSSSADDLQSVTNGQSGGPEMGHAGVGTQHEIQPLDPQREGVTAGEGLSTPSQSVEPSDGATEVGSGAGETPATEPQDGEDDPARPRTMDDIELTPRMLLANVGATQGLVAVLVVAAGWYFEIPLRAFGVAGGPWSTGLPAVAVGVVFGLALWVGNELATTVADAAGAAYDESVRELLAPTSSEGWVVLFAGVLPIIAVAEELLFRAALIGVPAAGFGVSPWLLALVASGAFALGHGAQGRVGIVVTGLLGLVLAAGYVLSGSLLLVVVAHYVVNAMEFAVYEYAGLDGLF